MVAVPSFVCTLKGDQFRGMKREACGRRLVIIIFPDGAHPAVEVKDALGFLGGGWIGNTKRTFVLLMRLATASNAAYLRCLLARPKDSSQYGALSIESGFMGV